MIYPAFRVKPHLRLKAKQDLVELVREAIEEEWRLTGKDFFSVVHRDIPEIYFTCDCIYGVITILERYMGHMWMCDAGIMEKIK